MHSLEVRNARPPEGISNSVSEVDKVVLVAGQEVTSVEELISLLSHITDDLLLAQFLVSLVAIKLKVFLNLRHKKARFP